MIDYISLLDEEEIKIIPELISGKAFKLLFQRNSEGFAKIKPGFRPSMISSNEAVSLAIKHIKRPFISSFINHSIDRWMKEIQESANIIQQALDNMPEGPVMAKVPKVLKPPKGDAYHRVENTRGELGFYIVSDGSTKPYRVHIRRPSFVNLQALDSMCQGMLLADAVTAFATIDPLMGEVDC